MDGGEPQPHTRVLFWSLFSLALHRRPLCFSSSRLDCGVAQDMPEEQQSVLLNPGWPSTMRDNMKPTPEQFENFVAVTEANGARL